MKCPHCLDSFFDETVHLFIGKDFDDFWSVSMRMCPSCKKLVLFLTQSQGWSDRPNQPTSITEERLIRPRGSSRPPCPSAVTDNIKGDYQEACLVIVDSPKASAALSRRCLQNLLREEANVKQGNLADEIQQVIDSGHIPTYLSESIDHIRNIGNFSAHPIKSQNTGEIVEVESGEAEWNLEVLELLFDFYFVLPEKQKAKRDALDQKLKDAGKPPMK